MKIHHITGYIQSIYLVEYNHGLLLLDGCCRADVKVVLKFIQEQLNRPVTDLKMIVVTHMHPDHAGAAHKLRKITQCQIASANKNNHWYRGINGVLMHWIDVVLTLYVGRKMGKPYQYVAYSRKLFPDIKLNEGDVVPGFEDWQILETPGHTDRDLTIYHPSEDCIYVADLIIKLRGRYIAPYPIFHPNKYRRSVKRVQSMQCQTVILAHGGMVNMSQDDFESLLSIAPEIPKTPLRSTLAKFRKMASRIKSRNKR